MPARKAPAKRPAARKTTTRRPPKPTEPEKLDLHELGARVVSVSKAAGGRVIVEIPLEAARELFPGQFARSALAEAVDGALNDLEELRERDPELASSALAGSVMTMAREIVHPYNSATSKSMCAREMREALDRLRELAPPPPQEDNVDRIRRNLAGKRSQRGRGTKAPAEQPPKVD